MAKFTRQAIMLSLLKLLEDKSIDKVTVKDICETCEINRNTFYYYFSDIYEVLEALMKYETEKSLKEDENVESFYEEFLSKYHLVLENKKAVWHIYNSKDRDLVLDFFYTITETFVKKYVIREAEGTGLSEEDIQFITDFYGNSMIGNTLRWLNAGMPDKQEELIRRLSASYQATIHPLIQSCIEGSTKGKDV